MKYLFLLFIIFIIFISEKDLNKTNQSYENDTQFELHKLLKDTLRRDDLQDSLINKLCDLER